MKVLRRVDPGLLVVLALFAVTSIGWDIVFRHGQPFDIDESGYLNISLLDLQSLDRGGLSAWLHQVEAPNIQSPLTTAATTPFYLLFGPSPLAALLVPLCFSLVTVAATYALARSVADRSIARGAAVLVATAPVVVNYSRDYHFAAAATAVTTVALYCLERSERLSSWRWSLAFGATLGLMPLARSMTVAFLPGFGVATAVAVLAGGQRWRRLGNLLLAIGVGGGVAALWLGVNGNGRLVWQYLTSYGYGAASRSYGQAHGFLTSAEVVTNLQLLAGYLFLPHLVLLLAGGCTFIVLGARRLTSRPGMLRLVRSPLVPLVCVTAFGLGALASSVNQGSAFVAPLVPAMCVLAAWSLFTAASHRRWIARSAIGAVALVAVVPLLPISWPLSGTWTVSVPKLGPVAMASGQGPLDQYIQQTGPPRTHRDPNELSEGRRWVAANQALADRLQGQFGNRAVVAFGFRHRLVNINSVTLAQLAAGRTELPLLMVPRETLDDSVAAYRAWLRDGSAARACLLLTASGTDEEIAPLVTEPAMSSAASAEGFTRIATWSLPDGRPVTEWERRASCPT